MASMTSQSVFSPESLVGLVPLAEIERTLGAGLKDLASELRLIDATDFAEFIRIGHMANLRSLVQSSAELHFKPGTLELAYLDRAEKLRDGEGRRSAMGPFPHDGPRATLSDDNPTGTDGFEFVEFAHSEPAKLGALFELMGFSAVARHRSKNVTLYRQGGVNPNR